MLRSLFRALRIEPAEIWPLTFILFGTFFWVWSIRHDPFFWDTVQLASKHAHFFYDNGLIWQPLPTHMDSGHPPFLGYYLAVLWYFFGKTLAVSHFALWPFLAGTAWLLVRLGQRIGGPMWGWWLLPIVWLDPVVAGQQVLVSPDVVVIFAFLLVIDGYKTHHYGVVLGVLLLCTTSLRGMMTATALLLWVLYNRLWLQSGEGKPLRMRDIAGDVAPFLPGFALGVGFLYWHHEAVGWTGFHPDSPWAPAFVRTDSVVGLLRNGVVVAWRWLDFGRILEWIVLVVCIYKVRRSGNFQFSWFALLMFTALLLTPSALLYKNLSAHRYFLPFFLSLHLFVFGAVVKAGFSRRITTVLFTILCLNMAVGNRWIYPMGISMDWDSTLAHLPFHQLRAGALRWLDVQGIDYKTVGTSFPAINTNEHLMLNGDNRIFAAFDLVQCQHLMVSNIFNEIEADVWKNLPLSHRLAYRDEHAGVWIEIWSKK